MPGTDSTVCEFFWMFFLCKCNVFKYFASILLFFAFCTPLISVFFFQADSSPRVCVSTPPPPPVWPTGACRRQTNGNPWWKKNNQNKQNVGTVVGIKSGTTVANTMAAFLLPQRWVRVPPTQAGEGTIVGAHPGWINRTVAQKQKDREPTTCGAPDSIVLFQPDPRSNQCLRETPSIGDLSKNQHNFRWFLENEEKGELLGQKRQKKMHWHKWYSFLGHKCINVCKKLCVHVWMYLCIY